MDDHRRMIIIPASVMIYILAGILFWLLIDSLGL